MNELSSAEKRVRFDGLKKIVKESLGAGQKLWGALTALKEEEFYLNDYTSWEEFCLKEFGISVRHADRLIEAGKTIKTIAFANESEETVGPTGSDSIRPSRSVPNLTERQVRELKKAPPEKRAEVIRRVEANGPVTAKAIADTAKSITAPSRANVPQVVLDETGYPIPTQLHEYWNRRNEIQELMSAVSKVKTRIEKARTDDDILFRPVNQAAIDQLERTYSFLSDAKPYAVCLTCQGRANDSCRVCKGTGLISKFGYETRADKDARTIRENFLSKAKS